MSYEAHQARLREERDQLIIDLSAIATQDPRTGDWVAIPETGHSESADENTEADITEEWNERRATLASLEIRYRNIMRALQKIDAGTYGVCEISGEIIEPERLDANPAARTNIANREREQELPL